MSFNQDNHFSTIDFPVPAILAIYFQQSLALPRHFFFPSSAISSQILHIYTTTFIYVYIYIYILKYIYTKTSPSSHIFKQYVEIFLMELRLRNSVAVSSSRGVKSCSAEFLH